MLLLLTLVSRVSLGRGWDLGSFKIRSSRWNGDGSGNDSESYFCFIYLHIATVPLFYHETRGLSWEHYHETRGLSWELPPILGAACVREADWDYRC